MALKSRVSSVREGLSDTVVSGIKSPLPTPQFYSGESFSAKKDRIGQRPERPPPTPRVKLNDYSSCSSISRLFSEGSNSQSGALNVSFQNPFTPLSSIYDKNNDKLYFHQCFEVISKIGAGSFGDVFKVRSKEDGKLYAVKRAKEKFAGKSDRLRKLQEVQKHELLPYHPNCVRFYKAWEENKRLYIQTELCRTSLNHFADVHHQIPENTVWNYLIDLLLAVKHLHDHDLVHLDIKPENIFVSSKGVCKLGDFGLVLDLSKSDDSDAIEGDPRYLAPELMQGMFTKAADIFSLGITILELASDLDLPRGGESWHQLRNLKIPEGFVKGLSVELVKVISIMMEPDYIIRPSADLILNLQIMRQRVKMRKRLLKLSDSGQNVKTPSSGHSRSIEWSSSLSDDVFDKDSTGNDYSLNYSQTETSILLSDDIFGNDKNNYDAARARLAMSTPCGLRYWDSRGHDNSCSPRLTNGKKKSLSPDDGSVSPLLTKSPRLQLFNDSSSEGEEEVAVSLGGPRNLLSVFNTLSPTD